MATGELKEICTREAEIWISDVRSTHNPVEEADEETQTDIDGPGEKSSPNPKRWKSNTKSKASKPRSASQPALVSTKGERPKYVFIVVVILLSHTCISLYLEVLVSVTLYNVTLQEKGTN